MMQIIAIVLWIVIGIKINQIYHRIFHVIYFGEKGLLRELIVTILVSGFIVAVIFGAIGSLL